MLRALGLFEQEDIVRNVYICCLNRILFALFMKRKKLERNFIQKLDLQSGVTNRHAKVARILLILFKAKCIISRRVYIPWTSKHFFPICHNLALNFTKLSQKGHTYLSYKSWILPQHRYFHGDSCRMPRMSQTLHIQSTKACSSCDYWICADSSPVPNGISRKLLHPWENKKEEKKII